VAQKLHDTYGFSYDNLKVLLGGWNAWNTAGYPTESSAAPTAASSAPISGSIPLTGSNPIVITGGATVPPPKP
jgi:hypothetical protein